MELEIPHRVRRGGRYEAGLCDARELAKIHPCRMIIANRAPTPNPSAWALDEPYTASGGTPGSIVNRFRSSPGGIFASTESNSSVRVRQGSRIDRLPKVLSATNEFWVFGACRFTVGIEHSGLRKPIAALFFGCGCRSTPSSRLALGFHRPGLSEIPFGKRSMPLRKGTLGPLPVPGIRNFRASCGCARAAASASRGRGQSG